MSLVKWLKMQKAVGKLPRDAEMALNGLQHSDRTVRNMDDAAGLWRQYRDEPAKRATWYQPGGPLDPVRNAEIDAAYDLQKKAELEKQIMGRFGLDDISQARGKKQAEKVRSLVDGFDDIFKGAPTEAKPLNIAEIHEAAQKPISKRDFIMNALEDDSITKKRPGSWGGDAAELLDPAGSGRAGYKHYKKQRKKDGSRLMQFIEQLRAKK